MISTPSKLDSALEGGSKDPPTGPSRRKNNKKKGKPNNIGSNRNLKKIRKKINKNLHKIKNKQVKIYVSNILSLDVLDFISKYAIKNPNLKPLYVFNLPEGFKLLNKFKNVSGVYFYLGDFGSGYVGATKDLYQRNFAGHKNKAKYDNIQVKFYKTVQENG